jgi:hypothetical protein
MKTSPRILNRPEKIGSFRVPSRRRRKLTLGILFLIPISYALSASQTNYCRATADDLLTSCQAGAQSDYSAAIARCDNFSDPGRATVMPQRCRGGIEGCDENMRR